MRAIWMGPFLRRVALSLVAGLIFVYWSELVFERPCAGVVRRNGSATIAYSLAYLFLAWCPPSVSTAWAVAGRRPVRLVRRRRHRPDDGRRPPLQHLLHRTGLACLDHRAPIGGSSAAIPGSGQGLAGLSASIGGLRLVSNDLVGGTASPSPASIRRVRLRTTLLLVAATCSAHGCHVDQFVPRGSNRRCCPR
jgi:hypothetical protein